MTDDLPEPLEGAVFYEDKFLYATLANFPKAKGHVVIVWKKKVTDLHLLSKKQYEHLMGVVEEVRTAMLKVLKVKKVYLLYMDEAKHVHWHLIPRYEKMGMVVLREKSRKLKEFSLAEKLRKRLG